MAGQGRTPKTDNAFIQYIDYHFDDEKMEFLFPNMKAPEKISSELKIQSSTRAAGKYICCPLIMV